MADGRNGILTGDVVAVGHVRVRVQFRDEAHPRPVSVNPRRLWCEDDQLSLFPEPVARPDVLDAVVHDVDVDRESASHSAGGGR